MGSKRWLSYGVLAIAISTLLFLIGIRTFPSIVIFIRQSPFNRFLAPSEYTLDVAIAFVSEVDDVAIVPPEGDKKAMVAALSKLKLLPIRNQKFLGVPNASHAVFQSLRKIIVVFRDEKNFEQDLKRDSRLKTELAYESLYQDEVMSRLFVGRFNRERTELTIPLYINNRAQRLLDLTADDLFSKEAIVALFANFQEAPLSRFPNIYNDVFRLLGKRTPKLFSVRKGLGIFNFLGKFSFISKVYAQACNNWDSDGGACSPSTSERLCRDGAKDGRPCYTDAECPDGTCVTHSGCDTSKTFSGNCHYCPDTGGTGLSCAGCFAGSYGQNCGSPPDNSNPPTPTPGGPTPTPGQGDGGSCSGNRCNEDWVGLCCDTPCPHTWTEGFYDNCGTGGPPVGCTGEWKAWSDCSGSPATRTRKNTCGDKQTQTCTGDIYAKAVLIDPLTLTCDAVNASTTPLVGTKFNFSSSSPYDGSSKTQSDSTPVFFNNVDGGNYTLKPTADSNYILAVACWTRNKNDPLLGQGLSTKLAKPGNGGELRWTLGYTPVGPWFQTKGGDVYSGDTVTSLMTNQALPERFFALDNINNLPGVLTHGVDGYDFNTNLGNQSDSTPLISSKKWAVQESYRATGFYQTFFRQFGAPTSYDVFPQDVESKYFEVAKPASQSTPYHLYKAMKTTGDWVIADGESYVFFVEGDVTIKGKITLGGTGSGFIAFIATGSITFDPTVGSAYNTTTPVIEGVYIADGSIQTGASSVVGKERLNAKGMFIANSFVLQRDLAALNQNNRYAAEYFEYNPRLLFTMPEQMKQVPYTWQEVAP